MSSPGPTLEALPDAAIGTVRIAGRLDWVGMDGIDVPVRLAGAAGGEAVGAARVAVAVDLVRSEVRGIHMSRLYRQLSEALATEALSPALLERLLGDFVASHRELSSRARLDIGLDLLLRRPALLSANEGWKRYPVALRALGGADGATLELGFALLYASTCPSSAALARQATAARFAAEFAADATASCERVAEWLAGERGMAATPHAQRSRAEVRVRLASGLPAFPFVALIDRVEAALATPVQTAVKRDDEREFARLNAENLMFCEDAARRMQAALAEAPAVLDFWLSATHFESLHAHDAVAVATRGLPGGYDGLTTGLIVRR